MIVHRHRHSFLCVLLADAKFIELALDLRWFWNREARFLLLGLCGEFLVEDVLAQDDAIIADINAGAGYELFYFRVRFAAEAAERDIRWASHSKIFDLRLTIYD